MKTALLLLLISGAIAQPQELAPAILAAPGGRFVFGQISSARADQYMLDTATGRLWEMVQSKDGVRSLSPVHYQLQGWTPPLVATNAKPSAIEGALIQKDIRDMLPPGYGVDFTTNAPPSKP